LPEEVIAHASEIVGSDYINMDKYLQDISRDKRYWERKRDEIRRERKRLDEAASKYEAGLDEIRGQRKEILARAREEAERMLAESNARIENTIRGIKEAEADKEKTRQLRQSLHAFREEVKSADTTNSPRASAKAGTPGLLQAPGKKREKTPGTGTVPSKEAPKALAVGNTVRLKGQTSPGEIMEIAGKKATVAFGMIKTTVPLDKLERVSGRQLKKEAKAASNTRDMLHERKLNFKPDIDVRGMRGDEALVAVTYFIDDAIQLGIPRVRILHGTGTGVLRQIIREYLGTVNGVTRFQDEHVQFGGAGITVIDME
ncbi:MAG: Smr/MutS family protein, partial [Proteiniphilum sp.]